MSLYSSFLDKVNDVAQFMPPGFWAYWFTLFGLLLYGAMIPNLTGLYPNLQRVKLHPLNIPFDGCNQFDLRCVEYNTIQKIRHMMGYISASSMILSGYVATSSGVLHDHIHLERYARYVILLAGLLTLPGHYQFNHER